MALTFSCSSGDDNNDNGGMAGSQINSNFTIYGFKEMETSPCKGKGISLIYKGAEAECKSNGGPYGCSYQPSLLIASCDGAKIQGCILKHILIFCLLAFGFASAAEKSLAIMPCMGDFDQKGLENLRDKLEEVAVDVSRSYPSGLRVIPYDEVKKDIGAELLYKATCMEDGVCIA